MKNGFGLLVMMLGLFYAGAALASPPLNVEVIRYSNDLDSALQLLERVEQRLVQGQPLTKKQERRLSNKLNRARRTLERELNLAQIEMNRLESRVCEGVIGSTGPVALNLQFPGPPPGMTIVEEEPLPEPMAEDSLQTLEATINNQTFPDDKVGVLQQAAGYSFFTVQQVQRLLSQFTFSSNKVDALKLLAPQIIDPENGYQLMDAFFHSSDKEEARLILGRS